MDRDSIIWVSALRSESAAARNESQSRLHQLLLRVAFAEAHRRSASLPSQTVSELDDLCSQAANDALVGILGKIDDFQGLSRFTTWACKFVILEISSRLRRSAWRDRRIEWTDEDWNRLEESSPGALQQLEEDEKVVMLRTAISRDLTERQRQVLLAAIVDEVPIDVLAERLNSSRGAIYKILHDARVKLRRSLTPDGQSMIRQATETR